MEPYLQIPSARELETRRVLKQLPKAYTALAELKGIASTIPNQGILLNTLILREAKYSSAIENIITSHDELYKSQLDLRGFKSISAKEVQNYFSAMMMGYSLVKEQNLITNSTIKKIQSELEQNNAGYRSQPGTKLKNDTTGEIVYVPPQNPDDILTLMDELVTYIHQREEDEVDPLIRMAVIHHQFESIHPYYDGNGRTGRILNILYLILEGLQDLPILYLSRFIIRNKETYYRLLQTVRDQNEWEEWLIFMIDGVQETALDTLQIIRDIKELMLKFKHRIRADYKFYSQDLINNLFKHPYTKIELVVEELQVSRLTAANYLNLLADDGILTKQKLGRSNYYINHELYAILSRP
jgi:Fic family protein